jgi:uncharacterized protein Yka (UPF0111/DUF47 family)
MATVICLTLPAIPKNLKIAFPGVGELVMFREAIDKLPRPSTYVLKAFNSLTVSLAPIRAFLRIVAIITEIVDCVSAIKDAITQLSPGPIIECIQNLLKRLAELAELLPPISYLRLMSDILGAIIALIDDLLSVVGLIDAQVSRVKAAIARGAENNDAVLISIGNCAKQELKTSAEGLLELFEALGAVLDAMAAILGLLAAILPSPFSDKVKAMQEQIKSATSAASSISVGDFPPLGQLVDLLVQIRDIASFAKGFVDAALGRTFALLAVVIPTLENP